jgi:hypothetical protein
MTSAFYLIFFYLDLLMPFNPFFPSKYLRSSNFFFSFALKLSKSVSTK